MARTPRKDRCATAHGAPNHISNTVPPTIYLGPQARGQTLTSGRDAGHNIIAYWPQQPDMRPSEGASCCFCDKALKEWDNH